MTGTNCDLFTHNQSRSYLNHLVVLYPEHYNVEIMFVTIPYLIFSQKLTEEVDKDFINLFN
jgi:hypothetical protein